MAGDVSPERKALQRKARLFCGLGVGLQVVFNGSLGLSPDPSRGIEVESVAIVMLIGVASLVLWVIGLSAYARSKGYSRAMSLLGLLSCVGLLVMALLPNKWVDPPSEAYVPGDYPRPGA